MKCPGFKLQLSTNQTDPYKALLSSRGGRSNFASLYLEAIKDERMGIDGYFFEQTNNVEDKSWIKAELEHEQTRQERNFMIFVCEKHGKNGS